MKAIFTKLTRSLQKKISNIIHPYKQYIADGSFLFYSNIIASITNFGIVYILANYVPQETFGTYKYVLSIASVLSIFTLQGMNTAIAQSVSRGNESALQEGVKKKILFGIIGALGGLCVSVYYFSEGNSMLGSAFLITALATPFFGTFNLYRSYLNGKKQYSAIAQETTFYNLIFFGLFASTLLITDNIVIILFCYFLFSILLQLFIYVRITKTITTGEETSDREIVRYGKHLSHLKGLTIASGSIGSVALWHILGPLALPVYTLALAPIEQIRPILQLAENLLMPNISQESWQAHSVSWFFKKSIFFFLAILFFVIIYIALAPLIYKLFFPGYLEATFLSQIFSVSLLLTGLNILLMTIMKSKKQISNLHISGGIMVLFDLLAIPAIYLFGILGLIINIMIGKAVISAISLFLIFRKNN